MYSSNASSRHLSFREEAEARAARFRYDSSPPQETTTTASPAPTMMNSEWRMTSDRRTSSTPSPLHPLQESEWQSSQQQPQSYASSLLSSASSLFQSSNNTSTSTPTAAAAAALAPSTPSASTTAAQQAWRRHGSGLSQLLEEKRNFYGQYPGCYVVRIVSAEPRVDLSGATYTAYLIRVITTHTPTTYAPWDYLVEHRYSDFSKLQQVLEQAQQQSHNPNIVIEAAFPSKHWAGRLGNWTPSLTWAPDQHDDLIQFRKIQLDVWLVHVVHLYNQHQQQQQQQSLPAMLQTAIYDFLQPTQKPPCDQIHDWALSKNLNSPTSSSNNNTTLKSLWEQAKWNNPLSFTLGSSIRQAVTTIHYMCNSQQPNNDYNDIGYGFESPHEQQQQQQQHRWQDSDASIPQDLLHAAKGLMFLTVFKAGLVVSGRLGTGLIVAKIEDEQSSSSSFFRSPTHAMPSSHIAASAATPSPNGSTSGASYSNQQHQQQYQQHRWSAPCALGTLGMGWGALAGGDVTHYLIVFTSQQAVRAMVGASSIQFGAEVDVAVGPMGRGATSHLSASHHDWSLHPAYAYAHSQGFFAGISLEGSIVAVRPEVNAKFYGQSVDALTLLQRPGVNAAVPLYQALDQALGLDIPRRGIRPSQIWSSPTTTSSVSSPVPPQTPSSQAQQSIPTSATPIYYNSGINVPYNQYNNM